MSSAFTNERPPRRTHGAKVAPTSTAPHHSLIDEHAERQVLAAFVGSAAIRDALEERVKAADFGQLDYSRAFEVLRALHGNGLPFNENEAVRALATVPCLLENLGGENALRIEVLNRTADICALAHAERVSRMAYQRRLQAAAQAVATDPGDPDTSARLHDLLASGGAFSGKELLRRAEFNPSAPPKKPAAILTVGSRTILAASTLLTLSGQAKVGKSALLGAIVGSLIEPAEDSDLLGFKGSNFVRKAVLHFDCEQSEYDHWRLLDTARRRVVSDVLPLYLKSYRLLSFAIKERLLILKYALKEEAQKHDGVCCVIIDGIADLVADPNDAAESSAIIDEMRRLAEQYTCGIILVLHENPSQNGQAKTRGHLGSQLERKSETNLRLVKENGVTSVFSENSRSFVISKGEGPSFEWNAEASMHVSTKLDMDKAAHRKSMLLDILSRGPVKRPQVANLLKEQGIPHSSVNDLIKKAVEARTVIHDKQTNTLARSVSNY